MAKKKLRLKPKKQTIRKLRRSPQLRAAVVTLLFVLGFGLGAVAMRLVPYDQHPQNVVWAADKTVAIPGDLVQYLQRRNDCVGYRGSNNPAGVGLWAVYQVARGKFAKISYGCSTGMTTYIMAVKADNKWQLLPPADYFSTTGFLPKCSQLEKYQISKTIEPFCIQDNGAARSNNIN